jgi:hypothetical protein
MSEIKCPGRYLDAGDAEGHQPRTSPAALALKRGKSADFTGYWQRHIATA